MVEQKLSSQLYALQNSSVINLYSSDSHLMMGSIKGHLSLQIRYLSFKLLHQNRTGLQSSDFEEVPDNAFLSVLLAHIFCAFYVILFIFYCHF